MKCKLSDICHFLAGVLGTSEQSATFFWLSAIVEACVGEQNLPYQNVSLWLKDYLGLVIFLIYYLFIYLLTKISPELTAANPPLFAKEDWPRANICAHLPLLYMWDAYHSMVCQAVPCVHPGSELANPRPMRSGTCALNLCATGPAPP